MFNNNLVQYLGANNFNIIEGPTTQVFDELFEGKDWRHLSKVGTTYRGEFLENGFGKYWGGEGYGNSDKYMAQQEAILSQNDSSTSR
jgi:hypothetical protein